MISTQDFRIEVDGGTAMLSVHHLPTGVRLGGVCWDEVAPYGEGRGRLGLGRARRVDSDGRSATLWFDCDQDAEATWRVSVQGEPGSEWLLFRVELRNCGAREIRPEALLPFCATGGVEPAQGPWQWFDTGYQSFSPAETLPVAGRQDRPRLPVFQVMGINSTTPRGRRKGELFADWMGALGGPAGSIAFGFVDFAGKMADVVCLADRDGRVRRLAAQSHAEGIPVPPGGVVASGALGVFFGRGPAPLAAWAAELGRRQGARVAPRAPAGWCSWYRYFTKVTAKDVDENLAALAPLREKLGLVVFQLDDGYQPAVGDWLETNRKFPGGVKPVADKIRAAGFAPGLWLAPFFARHDSELFRRHRDWFLRDGKGRPRNAGVNPLWGGFMSALDLTHPEVKRWLREVFRALAKDRGFDFLKIDFLYAGALDGARHDPTKTRYQSYREALELIREEIGPDRVLLGCGAPLGPSVGLVDLMRIGPDVDPHWRRPLMERITGLQEGPSAYWSLRNSLTRQFLHGKLWVNDPDCLMVRAHETSLDLAEVRTLSSALGLLGGMLLVSDDMSRLEPDRAAMLERLLPPASAPAEPPDPFAARVPDVLRGAPRGERRPVALFHWGEAPATRAATAQELGVPAGRVAALDFWEGRPLEADLAAGPLALRLARHGSAVLHVAPESDRPHLVGTTVHIAMEEVQGERWDGAALILSAGLPGGRSGEWWLRTAGRALEGIDCEGMRAEPAEAPAGWLRLKVEIGEKGSARLRFRAG